MSKDMYNILFVGNGKTSRVRELVKSRSDLERAGVSNAFILENIRTAKHFLNLIDSRRTSKPKEPLIVIACDTDHDGTPTSKFLESAKQRGYITALYGINDVTDSTGYKPDIFLKRREQHLNSSYAFSQLLRDITTTARDMKRNQLHLRK